MGMFAKAKTVTEAPKKKSGKPEKVRVAMGADMDTLAAIVALTKALAGLKIGVENSIRTKQLDYFVTAGMEHKKRPDSFVGEGSISRASCELRKRASTSPLTAEEVETLTNNGISVTEAVIKEEQFYFNPKLLANEAIATKIEEALEGIPELKGQDIVLRQAKSTKNIVGDTALDEVMRLTDPALVNELTKVVGVLATKPSLNSNDVTDAFKVLKAAGLSFEPEAEAE